MEGPPWDDMPYDYSEGQYAVRVGLAGLCTARPAFEDACSSLAIDNTPLPHPPREHHRTAPCHQVFIERRAPRERDLDDYRWFFHNVSGITLPEAAAAEHRSESGTGGRVAVATASTGKVEVEAQVATSASTAVGAACDGSPLSASLHRLFGELDRATRDASSSKDYSAAALAFRALVEQLGDLEAVLQKFGCVGVSRFYAEHLLRWPMPPSSGGGRASGSIASGSSSAGGGDGSAAARTAPPLPAAASPSPPPPHLTAPRRRADGTTDWRSVPPPSSGGADGGGPSASIPKIIIQTWKSRALPERWAELVSRVRQLHPHWTHLFFEDEDIAAFVKERQPRWWPLYEALNAAPIQRIDLFRYLAVEHFGGVYLDVDVLLMQPLDELLRTTPQGAAFPFERMVDATAHSTLVDAVGFGGLVGQCANRSPTLRAQAGAAASASQPLTTRPTRSTAAALPGTPLARRPATASSGASCATCTGRAPNRHGRRCPRRRPARRTTPRLYITRRALQSSLGPSSRVAIWRRHGCSSPRLSAPPTRRAGAPSATSACTCTQARGRRARS